MLRLVRPDEWPPAPHEPASARRRRRRIGRRSGLLLALVGAVVGVWLYWWSATTDVRALRALPEPQRRSLLRGAVDNLKNVCDPAAPVALRDFCRRQAELAVKFRECERDGECQQLARRHLYQPHR